MPTNLYGPNDNYDLQTSHVLPALLHRFNDAKLRGATSVTAWGTGSPRREFMHVDDMADAGQDLTIRELTELVREAVGFSGTIDWDVSMPDGTPRKQLDVSRLHSFGWRHTIDLRAGLARTYLDFQRTVVAPLAGAAQ